MPNQAAGGLMPGANQGGMQQAVPAPAGNNTPAVGGGTNPFLPGVPTGQQQPGTTSPYNGALSSLNPYSQSGSPTFQPGDSPFYGFSAQNGQALASFLKGGAGFNPQVVQAMWAALFPQMQKDQANLLEQFSAEGLGTSSPAAYGLASLDSQYQAQFGGILASMYEQSISNYMNVLLAGKRTPPPAGQGFANIAGGISSLLNASKPAKQ